MSTSHSDIVVRRATPADLDGIIALRALCYPHHRSQEERIRQRYLANPRFRYDDDVLVAEADGAIVGTTVLIPFEAFAPGGRLIPLRGVASVAVSPLYRRRGVAGTLLRGALDTILALGAPVSALFPFEYAFYARYGWATVSKACLYRMPPNALPLFDERAQVRTLSAADLPAMQACHEQYHRSRGALGVRRPLGHWESRWTGDNLLAFGYPTAGPLEGILVFAFDSSSNLPLMQDLVVRDFAALTAAAHRGLLGVLAAMQEQVRQVIMPLPDDEVFPLFWQEHRLPEARMVRGEDFPIGEVTASFMLRLVDVAGALADRDYGPVTGSLGIRCRDPQLAINSKPMTLRITDGRPEVQLESFLADRWISCDVATLSQLWSGAVSATEAARWGRLTAADDACLAFAERAFRTPHRPFLPDLDAF